MVEIDADGLTWIKSSESVDPDEACVEMAAVDGRVLFRCSRNRRGSHLNCSKKSWAALLVWMAAVEQSR